MFFLQCLAIWSIIGFFAVLLMPAPCSKFSALLQGFLGGPFMWVMILIILLDKWARFDDDIES